MRIAAEVDLVDVTYGFAQIQRTLNHNSVLRRILNSVREIVGELVDDVVVVVLCWNCGLNVATR